MITALCKDARLFLQRPDDMIGSGGTKPYWPPDALADALERIHDILCLPSGWLWGLGEPDILTVILFVGNSFIWGFSLTVVFCLLFTRLRFHHEQRIS